MHEQSDLYKVRDQILGHKIVQEMDVHERATLVEDIRTMAIDQLDTKLGELNEKA